MYIYLHLLISITFNFRDIDHYKDTSWNEKPDIASKYLKMVVLPIEYETTGGDYQEKVAKDMKSIKLK